MLVANLGSYPQRGKEGQGNKKCDQSDWEADVEIAVGVVHRVMAEEVPSEEGEDGQCGREEEGEKGRGEREQQALEKAEALQWKSKERSAGMALSMCGMHRGGDLSRLEYSFMQSSAQIELWPAERVAAQVLMLNAANGLSFAPWGETRVVENDLERLVGSVPALMAPALKNRAYYFVPLAIADTGETLIAPSYTVELGDRAVCHRNAAFGTTEAVFLSTRLVEDRFGLAFEFFINVAHNFVDAAGVPESFSQLVWSQAEAQVRGETSQDAWESRRRSKDVNGAKTIDERARGTFYDASFSDALAIYMLSLAVDFDYHDLREREYPLLAAPALAERLRHVAGLFPPNAGYEFQILYRRKG